MKKNNIGVLITIIILLVIFVPCAIYGTYMNFKGGKFSDNPNREFYYNGELYFYDGEKLLGKYTCKTEDCGYATNYVDETYEFESFNKNASEIKIINNLYAFIKDGEEIILYNVASGMKIVSYKAVKNYSVGINNSYYLVKNTNDLWGMIQINENVSVGIPNSYSYLGLINNLNDNLINEEKVIAKTEENWQILTNKNNSIFTTSEEIVSYTDNVVITKLDNSYHIFDYENNSLLNNYVINEIKLLEDLVITTTNNRLYVIYSTKNNSVIGTIIKQSEDYNFVIENDNLVVSSNDNVIQTIALN